MSDQTPNPGTESMTATGNVKMQNLVWSHGGFAPGPWASVRRSDFVDGVFNLIRVEDSDLVLIFTLRSGQPGFVINCNTIKHVEKQGSGFNIAADVLVEDEDGTHEFCLAIPKGRMKQLFAFMGHKL